MLVYILVHLEQGALSNMEVLIVQAFILHELPKVKRYLP